MYQTFKTRLKLNNTQKTIMAQYASYGRLNKFASFLAKNYSHIVVEDVNVSEILKNQWTSLKLCQQLTRAISNQEVNVALRA